MNKEIAKLHIITDSLEVIEQTCYAGAEWIQLRMKSHSQKESEEKAFSAWEICESYGAKLIVNDNVELAKKVKAHGVHLGKNDMHLAEAREYLGDEFVIGGTANTQNDVNEIESVVDYIGLGPFRFTETKRNLSPVLGLEGYTKVFSKKPIIAIGGIKETDIEKLMQTGICGVAVSSAIAQSKDSKEATQNFLNKLNHATVSYC